MRLGRELFSACGRDVDVTFRACERRTRAFIIASGLALLFAGPVIAANGLSQARATAAAPEPALPAAGGLLPDLNPPAAPSTGLARAAVAAAEGAAGGSTELAVAVLDRETGEVALGARASEPYYTASLSKVVVAVDALDRRRLEGLVVTDPDIDLLRQAIGPSDDGAMNALWSRFDGAGAAGRVSSRLRLPGTTAPLWEAARQELTRIATAAVQAVA